MGNTGVAPGWFWGGIGAGREEWKEDRGVEG
jgi:hypothetical protein